ncbi:uncharacterized protein LOC109538504 [Dendroctonus ponderosae]|uniref:uncharacterized protein LOC109538504 n=1 Tax=Dendroctonus ponderosae TaxID=77166 RepID=UPI0020356D52|nr:uncharacterized protein LOC109538504 [Dendroctonus ponderosae]KAH1028224.1 hypothetical protein HUJ05_001599 [Dendroctonus ponderosae]
MEPPADETLLFLDFKNPLPASLLQSKVFLRLVDLEGPRPLVQVNDQIFQGSYEHSIGTNMFFSKTSNKGPAEFPFFDPVPFKLEPAGLQSKVLACSQMLIPSTGSQQLPSTTEDVKFNLNWDYKELLQKFAAGKLDLQDIIAKEGDEHEEVALEIPVAPPHEQESNNVTQQQQQESQSQDISDLLDLSLSDELQEMYDRLLNLARTPVRHMVEPEEAGCVSQYQQESDYKTIEAKVLCRPLFAYLKPPKHQGDLDDVDVEKCTALGFLPEHKNRVMTVENFENLDLPARYSVLLTHAEELERTIAGNSPEQNLATDEFGRTPSDTLSIFKRLLAALQKRIHGIKQAN